MSAFPFILALLCLSAPGAGLIAGLVRRRWRHHHGAAARYGFPDERRGPRYCHPYGGRHLSADHRADRAHRGARMHGIMRSILPILKPGAIGDRDRLDPRQPDRHPFDRGISSPLIFGVFVIGIAAWMGLGPARLYESA